MSSRAQFIVLCEDLQAQVFIYRALQKLGVNRRKIYPEPLPNNGAGDAYVIKNYPDNVEALRKQNATYGLVVHVDADPGNTVSERHSQLAQRLKEEGLPPRRADEPIAELVPKRNIETWIYALDPKLLAGNGQPLDQEREYSKLQDRQSECATAAGAFADFASTGTEPAASPAVPSLLDGLAEFRRLPK